MMRHIMSIGGVCCYLVIYAGSADAEPCLLECEAALKLLPLTASTLTLDSTPKKKPAKKLLKKKKTTKKKAKNYGLSGLVTTKGAMNNGDKSISATQLKQDC